MIQPELLVGEIRPGMRVRLLQQMTNENSTWKPVEENMTAGLEGTVLYVNMGPDMPEDCRQIGVRWDNGSRLNLLPDKDFFQIIPPNTEDA